MKKFLIVFILIAFVTVSCVGPNKVGWTRKGGDFSRSKFEEDREVCILIIDHHLPSEVFGQALEECLAWQGYRYEPARASSRQALKKEKKGEWKKTDFSQDQFAKDLKNANKLSRMIWSIR